MSEKANHTTILKVAIPSVPFFELFDYLCLDEMLIQTLQPGVRLKVPFGRQTKVAFFIEISDQSAYPLEKIKPIINVIDHNSLLSAVDLALLRWVSQYYHAPIGDVINAAFPVALRQGKPANVTKLPLNKQYATQLAPLQCNQTQQAAIDSISQAFHQFSVFLLDGVTGSGKTEVYMQLIEKVLQNDQQILVLVPEITLTPQLQKRFEQRFNQRIAISHSKLSDNQRKNAWLLMQNQSCQILLGTRSAVFTPMPTIGLIILDEEHDSSFKQQEGIHFSARDVAVMRGKLADIPVVLGSATPSFESLYNVQQRRYQHLKLPFRAGVASSVSVELIDICQQRLNEGLSTELIAQIHTTLAKNEQVLLFINRRGFAPTLMCHYCAWVACCHACDANLVIHQHKRLLRCHHCGSEQDLVVRCPRCSSNELVRLGLGTERIESVLAQLFVGKTIVRLDRDSIQRKGALEHYLLQILSGDAHIILGTQLLAKGHHFPNVTVVAILDVDSGLFSTDFHAHEKLAQLIIQVSGRAGRADKAGKVLLQTRQPNHQLLTELLTDGYETFAKSALKEREIAGMPPYSYQALMRAQADNESFPCSFLETVAEYAQSINEHSVKILGPISAPMAKRAGSYRYQLLFQHHNRRVLQQLLTDMIAQVSHLKLAAKVRWSLDVDPIDLY